MSVKLGYDNSSGILNATDMMNYGLNIYSIENVPDIIYKYFGIIMLHNYLVTCC